jgi:cytochrome c-type biogenesis protein
VEVQVSLALAFGAGAVSFLSACVLPVVSGYLGFIAALTLEERAEASVSRARRGALAYSLLFMAAFGLVLLSLGLVPTSVGPPIAWSLPWLQRAGGLLIALYGLYLISAVPSPPGPVGRRLRGVGSFAAGIAFGAGWTPCIGPVLGSILLYVTLGQTMARGLLLLVAYAVGLSVPFVLLSVGLNWPLAGSRAVEARSTLLRWVAGALLMALGLALVTGWFVRLTAFLAGLGQLINLEL